MDPVSIAFFASFGATLIALGVALVSGRTGKRGRHLIAAPAAVVLLGVTIVLAERLARAREFPPEELRIHLWFAKSAALLVFPVIGTGLWLTRSGRARPWHRVALVLFLVDTLIATGTGIWVFGLSVPR